MRVPIKSKYRDNSNRRKATYYRMLARVPVFGDKGQLYWAYAHPESFSLKPRDTIETETGMLVIEINVHDASYARAGLVTVDTDGIHGVIDWDAATHRGVKGNVHTVEIGGKTMEFNKP